jgi:hypothetical protein
MFPGRDSGAGFRGASIEADRREFGFAAITTFGLTVE